MNERRKWIVSLMVVDAPVQMRITHAA